jgi:hypothetical protein
MLDSLHLKNVGPAPQMDLELAPRLNLITGDNGLGKSFLLDVAWWALTRTWAGAIALPTSSKRASIAYVVHGKSGAAQPVVSTFRRETQTWPADAKRPPIPGIVVYIRIDGGFSVWDPARNYWRKDASRPAAYHFASPDVWDGLDVEGQRVCEGLERDWVSWQEARKPQFRALEQVLRILSPVSESLRPGPPRRLFLGEGRDRPTLIMGDQEVPVVLASAGVRRALALAYFLVWAWHEHRVAAQLLGRPPESRFVILFDEPETHLHPRWQRTIVPSVLAAVDALRGRLDSAPQLLITTHAPLILASLKPQFDENIDELFHLNLQQGRVTIESGGWAKQGDATSWLVSDVFGLEQARSLEAEQAIEAAEALMRGERDLPEGLDSKEAIHRALQRLLPAHDEFWPRWLVEGEAMVLVRPRTRRRPA